MSTLIYILLFNIIFENKISQSYVEPNIFTFSEKQLDVYLFIRLWIISIIQNFIFFILLLYNLKLSKSLFKGKKVHILFIVVGIILYEMDYRGL